MAINIGINGFGRIGRLVFRTAIKNFTALLASLPYPEVYDTIPLIKIDNWNFRWQYFYTFKKMLKIPAGSKIIVEATYDNTIQNPDNPFSPPQTVAERKNLNGKGSMKTSNEMLQFIINYLPYQQGDENISLDVQ